MNVTFQHVAFKLNYRAHGGDVGINPRSTGNTANTDNAGNTGKNLLPFLTLFLFLFISMNHFPDQRGFFVSHMSPLGHWLRTNSSDLIFKI